MGKELKLSKYGIVGDYPQLVIVKLVESTSEHKT